MRVIPPAQNLDQHTQNVSVARTLNGNVSPGNGLTFDSTGQPVTFSTDNQSGILIRIGSNANPYMVPASWPATANTDVTIAHNLNKVPYGFHIVSKNKACDVFLGTVLPAKMNITLQCTDPTADVTVFVMV
jgi:hypothetical protein